MLLISLREVRGVITEHISPGLITTRSPPDIAHLPGKCRDLNDHQDQDGISVCLSEPFHFFSPFFYSRLNRKYLVLSSKLNCTLLSVLPSTPRRMEQSLFDVCLLFCCLHIQKYKEERILFLTSLCYRI